MLQKFKLSSTKRFPFPSDSQLSPGYFFSSEIISEKLFFKLSLFVCHYKSWSTKNIFQSKINLAWFPRKYFSGKFGQKTLSGNYEKLRNVILFTGYIKFDPQTFDCYIYFVLNIYFSI